MNLIPVMASESKCRPKDATELAACICTAQETVGDYTRYTLAINKKGVGSVEFEIQVPEQLYPDKVMIYLSSLHAIYFVSQYQVEAAFKKIQHLLFEHVAHRVSEKGYPSALISATHPLYNFIKGSVIYTRRK